MSTLVWVLAGALAGITTVLAAPLRSTPVSHLAQSQRHPAPRHRARRRPARPHALDARGRRGRRGRRHGRADRLLQLGRTSPGSSSSCCSASCSAACSSPTGAPPAADGAWSLSGRVAPLPDRLRSHVLVRRLPWVPAVIALVLAVVVPLAIDTNAKYFLYSRMSIIAIVVVSVTILTGWAGQLSLAQFALAGLGAMTMAGRRPPPQPAVPARAPPGDRRVRRGRRDHGHPVVPGAGHVPGDRHPGVRQRRVRVAVPPAHLQRRPRRGPLRARPTCASARST